LFALSLLGMSGPGLADAFMSTGMKRIDLDMVAYCVTANDINGDGRQEIIAGAFDHRVYVLNMAGTVLWSCDVGGLPYALAVGDVNGDGKKDIIAVVQDSAGGVVVLEYKKGIYWTFADDRPFLSVAVGDFEGDGKKEIAAGSFLGALYVLDGRKRLLKFRKAFSPGAFISALAFGDVDGKAGDELLIGTSNKGVFALSGTGNILWRLKPKSPRKDNKGGKGHARQWQPRYKMEAVQSISITDLTDDGGTEVIIGSRPCGLVTVLNGKGEKLWQKNYPNRFGTHTSASVVPGNFVNDETKELFCLFNGLILSGEKGTSPAVMLSASGDEMGSYQPNSAFFSVCGSDGEKNGYQRALLSSSVRGTGLNLVAFEANKGDPLVGYQDAVQLAIEPHLRQMKGTGAKVQEGKATKTFHFLYRCDYRHIYGRKGTDLDRFLRPLRAAPGEPAIIITSLGEKGLLSRLGKKEAEGFVEKGRILEIAAWFERYSIPFFLNVGKHARLYFTPETLGAVLQTAQRSCQGFIVDENSYTRTDLWRSFLGDLDRILSLLAKYPGKKLVMNEYLGFWHRFPLEADKFKTLFKPQYADIIVPVYKPNNIKSPELNMGVLVGLWKAGAVKNWGVGVYGDMWKWASVFVGTPGDVELRLALEGMSLGANYFVFARNVSADSRSVLDLAAGYKRYFEALYALISHGLITPIENPDLLVVSPVALQEAANPMEESKRALGTKVYWQEIYRMRGFLDTGFFLQATRENYLSRYCYDMANYYDGLFPKNAFGYVAVFPDTIDPSTVGGIESCYVVSADQHLYKKKGKGLAPVSLAGFVQDMPRGRAKLPLATPDAFVSAHRTAGGYIVYLVNPLLFETRDVTAGVVLNAEIGGTRITDVVSGEVLDHTKKNLSVKIPAGLFRILKIDVDQTQ